jgi:hypothetical protein
MSGFTGDIAVDVRRRGPAFGIDDVKLSVATAAMIGTQAPNCQKRVEQSLALQCVYRRASAARTRLVDPKQPFHEGHEAAFTFSNSAADTAERVQRFARWNSAEQNET